MCRWTADDATDYLVRVSGIARSKAELDVRRIITFPGQAVAPEYGHLKLVMLRRLAQSAIGNLKLYCIVTFTIKEMKISVGISFT